MKKLFTLLIISSLIISCGKNDDDVTEPVTQITTEEAKGNVEFIFIPKVGQEFLTLRDTLITPANEKMVINDFKFFVSEIGLSLLDASEKAISPMENDSNQVGIYLVDFSEENVHLNENGKHGHGFKFTCKAPVGEYADVRYQIGVPRQYNLADISTNPFPVNGKNGMYWSWNSGFKFLVINGSSPAAQGTPLHLSIGLGYRMLDYNFRSMLLAASREKITVEEGKTTVLTFEFDINSFLTNADGSHYSFAPATPNTAQVHGGQMSDVLHANAATAIELTKFETK